MSQPTLDELLPRLRARIADPATREPARKTMVELFGELGQEHPLASTYRRRLAALLY